MKLGAENRSKLIAACGLSAVALILIAKFLFFSGASAAPATAAATVAASKSSAAPTHAPGKKAASAPRSLDPTLRYDWLKASEDTVYGGNGRNIFKAQAEPIPAPAAEVAKKQQEEANHTPPPPPPPPPITLKFFGFANKPGEPKRIFLSQGEDIFIAREGDIIDRRYKVVRIAPNSVEIEDVLNNNRQSIPLTQG